MFVSKSKSIILYRTMLRIRMVEERIADLYPSGSMRTPTHISIGQEAVSTGVCFALRPSDAVFASHRSHAAYLAKGGDLRRMLAELYGRAAGACHGKAGSAHLASPAKNMYAAPILGAMIPVAVGNALSFSMDKDRRVSVVFFGDAAIEEGVCLESINFAVVKRLPVFFVCENNFYSTHTHIRFRQPNIPIYKRVKGFGIPARQIDGNDVLGVYDAARLAAGSCRSGGGPVFLECVTYRYREHVGPNFDFDNPYRTKEEVERWMRRCPIKRLERALIGKRILTEKDTLSFRDDIRREIDAAVKYADNSPWPDKETMTKDVY